MPGSTETTPIRLLRGREVERLTGLSRTSIWRLRRAGRFPRPVDAAGIGVRWREDEVAAWIDGLERVGENGGSA